MGSDQGFWSLLTRDERDALSALGRIRVFTSGATMCVEEEPATHVFILVTGWVKIFSTTSDGHEIVLALRGDGDIVGETAGDSTGYRNATVQALSTVRTLIVQYDKFSSFLESNPGAGRAYRRVVTQKFKDADTMLRSRAVTTGAQRLAGLLLDLADRYWSKADGVSDAAIPLSQEELGSLVGASRATVTRALNNWRRRGFVSTGQRRITIVDRAGLRQVAGKQT